jgi:hypothetical protein
LQIKTNSILIKVCRGIFALVFSCWAGFSAAAEEVKKVDPTDPTNVQFSITPSYDYTKLSEDGGSTSAFSIDTWIPLSEKDLFTIEFKIMNSSITGLPSETGFSDIRMKYFHLISTPDMGILRAVAPSFDLIVPTGDEDKGLGGGSWLLIPNIVLALGLSETVSAYPTFRYVHSIHKGENEGVFTGLLPDYNIPVFDSSDDGLMKFNSGKVRGLNFEMPISAALSDSLFFTATPNLFHNLANGGSTTFSSKFQLTYQPLENVSVAIETNVPFTGDNGFDSNLKLTATIFY